MTTAQTLCRRLPLASALLLPLTGCNTILLNAPGDIAKQQGDLIVVSTLLMLLIIVPVIVLTLWFAWRYRASNTEATYKPDWDHSTKLELVIWAAPLLIIIALGAITWITTHTLDPYRPLDRISADKPLAEDAEPLVVQVAALNRQWLFIYPEQGVASINELALPVDRPVRFELTATTVMHSFYVPALAGMIYAMPGMETKLHAVINEPGQWEGFASNYSGPTFNAMRFKFHGLEQAAFDAWLAKARAGDALDNAGFLELDAPFANPLHPYQEQAVTPEPVRYFGSVGQTLFHDIVNRCVAEGTVCMDALHAQGNHAGGHGAANESAHGETHGEGHAAPAAEAAAPAATEAAGHAEAHAH